MKNYPFGIEDKSIIKVSEIWNHWYNIFINSIIDAIDIQWRIQIRER
jgi:hypothetical protein